VQGFDACLHLKTLSDYAKYAFVVRFSGRDDWQLAAV
jgi:hypothetical protein